MGGEPVPATACTQAQVFRKKAMVWKTLHSLHVSTALKHRSETNPSSAEKSLPSGTIAQAAVPPLDSAAEKM